MFLSPVLLAGCSGTGVGSVGGSDSSSGDSSGGSSSGGSSSDIGSTDMPGTNYLSNYKISYRPSEDDDISDFIIDVKKQTNQVAFDLMKTLFAEYGRQINQNTITNNAEILTITIDTNGQYKQEYIKVNQLANGDILKSTNPLFSQDVSIGRQTLYDVYAHYGKYFNHENAIFCDYDLNDNLLKWNWNGGLSNNSAIPLDDGLNFFVNNVVYRKKLELALLLITAGYDITPTGNNYSAYTDGAELIEDLRVQYTNNVEFYNAVDEYVFNRYYKIIDHSGYTDGEVSSIASFIQNEIIGTSLVALDNTRFINVAVVQGYGENYLFNLSNYSSQNWYLKYNKFLNEESFASYFVRNGNEEIDGRQFYDDYFANSSISQDEIDQINASTNYAHQVFALQAKNFQTQSVNQITNQVGLVDKDLNPLSTTEIDVIYDFFIDTNADGQFTADFWDIDGDGNTTNVLSEKSGTHTIFIFSIRKQYFKNYTNTAYKIACEIARAPQDNSQKLTYGQMYNSGFDYEFKYPIIPASFFADYVNDEILLNDNGIMNMPTGYRRYQNVVVMPKQTFNFDEFYLFFARQPDATGVTKDFQLTVYLRYYDAKTNSFATWGNGESETQFYSVETVKVAAATNIYDLEEPASINLHNILSTAKINGQAKGNSTLYGFSNLPASNSKNPTMITKDSQGAKMYQFVDLPSGHKSITYSSNYLAEQDRTSYLEILFATDSNNTFQFALLPSEANA